MTKQSVDEVVGEKGVPFWIGEIHVAKRAVGIYGISMIVFIIGGALLVASTPESSDLRVLLYLFPMAVTIWCGSKLARILPLTGNSPTAHWIVTVLFSVLGCFGLLIYFFLLSDVKRAEKALTPYIERHHLTSQAQRPTVKSVMSPIPGSTTEKVHQIRSSPEYSEWTSSLRQYLKSKNSTMNFDIIQQNALNYGFAHKMSPQQFFAQGIGKQLEDLEFVYLCSELLARIHDGKRSKLEVSPTGPDSQFNAIPDETTSTKSGPIEQAGPPDVINEPDRLRKLFSLYESGAITEEEFKNLRDS